MTAIETTEEKTAKEIGHNTWVIDDSKQIETRTDMTFGVGAAAIIGVSVEIKGAELWEGLKELFK